MRPLLDKSDETSKKWNVIFSKIANDAQEPFSNELARRFYFSKEESEKVLSNIPLIFFKGISKKSAEHFKNEWEIPGVEILLQSQEEEKENSAQVLWPDPALFCSPFSYEALLSNIRVEKSPPGMKRLNQAIDKLSERFEEVIRDTGGEEEFKIFFNALAQILREVASKEQEQREKAQIFIMKIRAAETLRKKALLEISQKNQECERLKDAFSREILEIKQMFEKAAKVNQELEGEIKKRHQEIGSGSKLEQDEKSLLGKKIKTLEKNLETVETEKKKIQASQQTELQEAREAAEMICIHLQKKAEEETFKMRKEMEEKTAELERALKNERARTIEIQQKKDEVQKTLDQIQK